MRETESMETEDWIMDKTAILTLWDKINGFLTEW